jgi:threonine aldolase
MHQTGILAAAGLLALDRLPELAADHRRAAELAGGLRDIPGLTVAQLPLPTNMVLVRARGTSADVLSDMLTARGVLGLPLNDRDVRLVVHRDHEDEHIETAVRRCASLRVAPADEVRP